MASTASSFVPAALAAAAAALAPAQANAETRLFGGPLSTEQEIPAPTLEVGGETFSPDGAVRMTVDLADRSFELEASFTGLTSEVTVAHIHEAPAGETGPIIVDLDPASNLSSVGPMGVLAVEGTLAPDQLSALLAGETYVNVHTEVNAPGEIRGQLLPIDQEPDDILNFSSRGLVNPGQGVAAILIGGFIIEENAKTTLFRVVGSTLDRFNVPNALQDPTLEVFNAEGAKIGENARWMEAGQKHAILASGFSPGEETDAGLILRLEPGRYTVHGGSSQGAGIALVDIFSLPPRNVVEALVAASNSELASEFATLAQLVADNGLAGPLSLPGPFTVFAPTDEAFAAIADTLEGLTDEQVVQTLLFHVVPRKILSAELEDGASVLTLADQELTADLSDGVAIGPSNVIEADIETTNGVIHVIDAVLVPSFEE